MAKRLIDADALKCRFLAFMTGAHTTYLEDLNIIMMVNQAPTVDAACGYGHCISHGTTRMKILKPGEEYKLQTMSNWQLQYL